MTEGKPDIPPQQDVPKVFNPRGFFDPLFTDLFKLSKQEPKIRKTSPQAILHEHLQRIPPLEVASAIDFTLGRLGALRGPNDTEPLTEWLRGHDRQQRTEEEEAIHQYLQRITDRSIKDEDLNLEERALRKQYDTSKST